MNHIKKAYRYHYITDLINNGGGLSTEYLFEMKVTAIAFEEVGTIGEGKKSYDSIESFLEDAEAEI